MTDVIIPHQPSAAQLLPLHIVKDRTPAHIVPANSCFSRSPDRTTQQAFVSIGVSGVLTPREPLSR